MSFNADFATYGRFSEDAEARFWLMEKKKQDVRLLRDGWSAEEITWLARDDLKDWQIDRLTMKAGQLYDHDRPSNESQRIAAMGLDRIWRQPTPVNNVHVNLLHRELLNPTPPPTLGRHFQLPESRPSTAHNETVPRRVSTPPGFPAGMSQTRPQVSHQARAPHPLASNVFNYSAEYADYELPPHYAPTINPRSLHDTTFAFNPYVQPVTSPAPATKPPTLESGLATWYAEHVVSVLVIPGGFRRGVDGSDDKTWGEDGVIAASFARTAPYLKRMSSRESNSAPHRDTSLELFDPFGIAWKHRPQVSRHLVAYIAEIIQRMSIEHSAIIAAVWYLHGMGLHAGDGGKGRVLRKLLSSSATSHDEAIERRVATLGFLLAGKWLEDAAFETKHWAEVSDISIPQIIALEFAILTDIHCSLYISPKSWTDHLQKQWVELEGRGFGRKPAGVLVLDYLMDLMKQSSPKPKTIRIPPWQMDSWYCDDIDARLEAAFYAEPEEEEEEMFDDSYFHPFTGSNPLSGWSTPNPNVDMADTARFVCALVDDALESGEEVEEVLLGEEMEAAPGVEVYEEELGAESEDESEDEFLDYDGAKPFLPTMSEMRRSMSNSSTQSDLIVEWRDNVQAAVENRYDHIPYSPAPPEYQTNRSYIIPIPIPFH